VTFGNPNVLNTTASFSAAGTYKLRLTANDGMAVASDNVTITVTGGVVPVPNQPPAVNAGPDQSVTIPAAATLDGTVTDDGLPDPPGAVTTTWKQVSGPGTVTFANPNAVDTTASFSAAGTYELSLTANDGGVVASDTVIVTVTAAPTPTPNISLSPSQTDFGPVVLGKSVDKNIQIKNTGNANLTIGQITLPSNPFSKESDSCSNAVISPSSSCGLTIRFAPTSQNVFSGSFDIPSNDPDGTITATLAGKGRALNVSINSVDLVGQTVQVIVSVTDQFDAPVTTLLAGNFAITENGSPKSILSVSNIMKPPLSVGMVLDYSGSMIPYTTNVQNSAKSFIDLLDPINDEAEVIKFATDIVVMQSFTQDYVALKAAIDAPFPPLYPRSGTALYDALDNSIRSLSSRSNLRHHVIVAVSDGQDDLSAKSIDDVIASAVYNNVQVFTIGIGIPDNTVMQQLATETGGQYFYNPGADDLDAIYLTISEILSNEYTIEYTTSSVAGDTISLKVAVDDGGQLGEYLITVGL
jgi:VWFA-related protein